MPRGAPGVPGERWLSGAPDESSIVESNDRCPRGIDMAYGSERIEMPPVTDWVNDWD